MMDLHFVLRSDCCIIYIVQHAYPVIVSFEVLVGSRLKADLRQEVTHYKIFNQA